MSKAADLDHRIAEGLNRQKVQPAHFLTRFEFLHEKVGEQRPVAEQEVKLMLIEVRGMRATGEQGVTVLAAPDDV